MFHAWRSFSFDDNTDTIDVCVTCIRQVAALFGYREPQMLEDLRQAGETAKRILTKEKIEGNYLDNPHPLHP